MKPFCIGDTAFRLGKYIHDEIITCLEKSKVVLVLLTNNYCRIKYCMMEFQKATYLDKPVIFMVKDKVDEQLISPAMRLHYNHNTRIIWTQDNGKKRFEKYMGSYLGIYNRTSIYKNSNVKYINDVNS